MFKTGRKIRLGIIGLGFGQKVLLPAFHQLDDIEIEAVAAASVEKAKSIASKYNIPKACDNWEEVVNDNAVDALAIAVPPYVQEMIIPFALARKKPLFCEKPLALSYAKAKEFAEVAELHQLPNMVDFEFSASAEWLKAKELIEQNKLGVLHQGYLSWQVETFANKVCLDNWKANQRYGGGALYNFISHVAFNLEWLFGSIKKVLITLLKFDMVVGVFQFESGLQMNVNVGTSSYRGSGHRIEVYADNGSFQLVNNSPDVISGFTLSYSLKDADLVVSDCSAPYQQSVDGRISAVKMLAERFVNWCQTGMVQKPSFIDGMRANYLLEFCQLSYQRGEWVDCASLVAFTL